MKKLASVQSLSQLRSKWKKDSRYADLVLLAAERMGGKGKVESVTTGMTIFSDLAASNDETSVVEEINSYLDDMGVPQMKINY